MTINDLATNTLSKQMLQLSTMKRVNSAADDAAALSISKGMEALSGGMEQGNQNTSNMDNLLQVADGGLSSIGDSLQRIRELSLQAANGTMSADDKTAIQNEISQLVEGINDTVGNTQYNSMNLLDGSFNDKNTASNADGSGRSISLGDFSAKALGLEGYNVTGDFDLSVIDDALKSVNKERSNIGAISNTFNHTINSQNIALMNLASSQSGLVDTDVQKTVTELTKQKYLQETALYAQRMQMSQIQSKYNVLF